MFRRGGFGGGPFWGGPYRRRMGFPLLPMGGFGMGGYGMGGFGMGGSLLGDLAAGGIGYMMGKQSAQQTQQYPQYQAPNPQYQHPQYQPAQQPYQPPQTPQYQPPSAVANQQAPAASGSGERLAQLKLLGHLKDSGLLTNDEFEKEKQQILGGY